MFASGAHGPTIVWAKRKQQVEDDEKISSLLPMMIVDDAPTSHLHLLSLVPAVNGGGKKL